MTQLYPIMLAELRRAWPDTEIIFWSGANGYVNKSEVMWKQRRPLWAAAMGAVRAAKIAGDDKVHFCSTWMHESVFSGFPLAAGSLDALTNTTRTKVDDPVHPDDFPVREQSLEALCAAIANLIGA